MVINWIDNRGSFNGDNIKTKPVLNFEYYELDFDSNNISESWYNTFKDGPKIYFSSVSKRIIDNIMDYNISEVPLYD